MTVLRCCMRIAQCFDAAQHVVTPWADTWRRHLLTIHHAPNGVQARCFCGFSLAPEGNQTSRIRVPKVQVHMPSHDRQATRSPRRFSARISTEFPHRECSGLRTEGHSLHHPATISKPQNISVDLNAVPSPTASCVRNVHAAAGATTCGSSCSDVDFAGIIQRCISGRVVEDLTRLGFAVLDGVFPELIAEGFAQEISNLHAAGGTHLNCTHLVLPDGSKRLLEKAHIYEAEVTYNSSTAAACPLLAQWAEDSSLRTMLSVFWPSARLVLASQATKLQYNTGEGGCFPMHFDSYAEQDGRKITCIVYLNRDWVPSDGGELALFPVPSSPVLIQPCFNRMVFFSSVGVLHRVLPSSVPRLCFTTWLSESRQKLSMRSGVGLSSLRTAPTIPEDGASRRDLEAFLKHPMVYPHVCKLVHQSAWRSSLLESHPAGAGLEQALQDFDCDIAKLHSKLGKILSAAGWLGSDTVYSENVSAL